MNKSFYDYANVSLGLTFAAGLFQSIIHFQLGAGIYVLQSIGDWLLLMNLIALATSVFVLMYYHDKQYRVALATGIMAALTTFCGYLFVFIAMLNRELGRYTTGTLFLIVSVGIVYAISLIVSRAGKRPWLKRAGVFSLILGLIQLTTLIWYVDAPPMPINATLDTIRQWSSLAGNLLPVLLIMNFLSEAQLVKADHESTASLNTSEILMGLVALLALCSLVVGIRIAGEGYGQTHISGRARLLAQPFEAGRYISSQGDTMRYRLLKPLPYNPQKKYPLVVCLPYTCSDDNVRQVEACPPAEWLSRPENRLKYPAFLFVPRCPPNTGWGGVAHTPSVASLAIETIISLDKAFSIDAKRRYVTGVSRGGYGSWHFIGTHPELFAAAIPICGEGNPDLAKNMASIPVWAFHGAKDRNVPVSGSRDMIKAIKKAGGKPRYTEFPNAGHGIWEDVEKTPGLLDWLFAQQRN